MANLEGANLSGVNLTKANLNVANLVHVDLHEANLNRANLCDADHSFANLTYVDLNNASLWGAILFGCNFEGSKLNESDFGYVRVSNTNFSNVNFSSVINLNFVEHYGPSPIDHQTLAKSGGTISSEFLQGVGFKKWEIESVKLHNPDLSPNQITDIVYEIDRLRNISPIQYHNLFISYTSKDNEFVDFFEEVLRQKDITFWRDVHESTAGPLDKQIERGIQLNPTFLLILSKNSVNSDWVEFEVEKARELEKKLNRNVLCPISLDDSWKGCNWPGPIKTQLKKYNILDFSDWRNRQRFDEQFAKLLKGLGIYYRNN